MTFYFGFIFSVLSLVLFLVSTFGLSLFICPLKHLILERNFHFCLHSTIKMSELLCDSFSFLHKEFDIVVSLYENTQDPGTWLPEQRLQLGKLHTL